MSKWRRGLALVALIGLIAWTSVYSAIAQTGGSGLIISPPRHELEIMPGTTKTIPISLKNVSGIDITAKAEINDFESDNLTGEPKIFANQTEMAPTSIKSYVEGLSDIELAKDEKKDFELIINMPTDVAAGAYYGVIRYSAVPKSQSEVSEGGQVALTASVGTLVLVTVPGDITEQIQIKSLKVQKNDDAGTFFLRSPNRVAIEIENNGNGFSRPFGRVAVMNSRGKEIHSYEFNPQDQADRRANILPKSTRIFVDNIENVKSPGRYTVLASISHGSGGEVINRKISFWYIPTWLLLLIIFIAIAITLTIYVLYKRKFKVRKKKRGR